MIYKKYSIFLLTFFFPFFVVASESSGTIDTTNKYSKICHNETCLSYGRVNWKPTINTSTPGATAITITDNSISGYAWGDEIGWINLSSTGVEVGVSVSPSTGVVSGKAYANTGSWIVFNPTGGGVTINSHGQFTGWAWVSGPNGGWMKFDCGGDSATCVTTDWRPTNSRVGSDTNTNNTTNTIFYGGGGSSLNSSTNNLSNSEVSNLLSQIKKSAVGILNRIQNLIPKNNTKDNSDITIINNINDNQEKIVLEPKQSNIKIQNIFDINNDGIPDISKDEIIDEKSISGEYKRAFPFKEKNFNNNRCYLCIIERKSDNINQSNILRYGFVPKSLEIRIPTSKIFKENGFSLGYDIDAVSSSITLFAIIKLVGLLLLFI